MLTQYSCRFPGYFQMIHQQPLSDKIKKTSATIKLDYKAKFPKEVNFYQLKAPPVFKMIITF